MPLSKFLRDTYHSGSSAKPSPAKPMPTNPSLVTRQATVKRKTHGRRKKVRLYAVVVPKNRLRTIHETQNFGHGHPSFRHRQRPPRPNRRKRNGRAARRAA